MKKRVTIIALVVLVASLSFGGYRYAEKMCQTYLGEQLSWTLIKEQMSSITEGTELPKGEWSYGVDISHHQPIVSWSNIKIYVDKDNKTVWRKKNSVKTLPVDYVIMKASEGETFKDWRFKKRWRKAQASGYKRGAYHFFRPNKEASVQAQNFIEQVGSIGQEDFPPILDVEQTDGLPVEVVNKRALEWLQAMEKHYGRKPIVYANPHYLKNILSPQITQNYPIWVANYEVSRPSYKRWHMWQFTDRALVKGVGCVDLNVMSVPKDRH